MTTQELKIRKITIDYSDSPLGLVELDGYVHHVHELDGSQTILIRTKPAKDVEEFLNNRITGK